MKPLLIIDTNYLCHRAFHAMGKLEYGEVGTGAVFGVLRDIVILQDLFKTDRCVFAFDCGYPTHRHKLLPTYKSSRQARHEAAPEAEQEARIGFNKQVIKLRKDYLPMAGFRNVFMVPGFEADDIVASVAAGVASSDEGIIVATDQDLWQCMRPNVWCWNPHKKEGYTYHKFLKEWGVIPRKWPDIKALAGCSTDDVPGVKGVGEKTAAKWLRGELSPTTKAFESLRAARQLYNQNIRLVRLPYNNCPKFEIQPDEVTEEKWQALADRLGMQSIRDNVPYGTPRKSKGRKREKGFGFGKG